MFENLVTKIKNMIENANRSTEVGMVNGDTKSSLMLKENGDVVIAASKTAQYKINYDSGTSTEISMQSNTITNRKNIKADDITINKHKLNPQMYELTDMKVYNDNKNLAIGNLNMQGTVLVKTWDTHLEKWVLIRRPIYTPIFSNLLNIPTVPEDMDIDDDMDEYTDAMRKYEK